MSTPISRMFAAKKAIRRRLAAQHGGIPEQALGTKGQIECPTCGNTLRYVIARNGRIGARCNTADCVVFTE